jgi:hypothetical protein
MPDYCNARMMKFRWIHRLLDANNFSKIWQSSGLLQGQAMTPARPPSLPLIWMTNFRRNLIREARHLARNSCQNLGRVAKQVLSWSHHNRRKSLRSKSLTSSSRKT